VLLSKDDHLGIIKCCD